MDGIATGLAVDAGKDIVGRALKEIRDVWGFKDQLGRLEKKLLNIQAFLTDLGNGKHAQIGSSLVNNWLKDVKKVTCSAENLMDDYKYEMLRRKLEFKIIKNSSRSSSNQSPRSTVSFKKKWCSYMKPATNPLVFRMRMTYRVKQILSEFDELYKDAEGIGLKQVDVATKSASTSKFKDTDLDQIRENPSTLDGFIGREDDEKILLQMLRNPTSGIKQAHHLPIIAIVGLGGLGKTTLARHLFEHKANEGPFDGQKVWICVSENFDARMILREMVESVTKTKCELNNPDTIIDTLEGKLKGKRLFLVLDDVWNKKEDVWDSLKSQLQRIGVLVGSAILITTRSIDVARAACSFDVHRLEGLSEEDGWKLLTWQFSFKPSLDGVARSILNKCKGVPLAIKAIKRVLRSKDPSGWERIEQSNVWDIEQNPIDKNYVMPSLLLSYNHFNEVLNLQQCFACCAIFPKDRVIRKGELIALWLAQDLLYDEHKSSSSDSLTTTAETIGEKYIDILVNHSFLLKEEEHTKVAIGFYETICRYKMHDLVHDLASYVSKKDLLVCKAEDKVEDVGSHLRDEVQDADSHFRQLAFDLSENKTAPPETVTKQKLSKLRTISFWNGVPKWNTLICAKYMRTLIMAGIELEEVPTVIGQLVHLRYLDLSNNEMEALPESICKLYQLQTLRLIGCYKLKELPRELHRLENIRHIKTSSSLSAPKGVGQLTSLQTLPHLILRDGEGWTIDELGPLGQAKGEMYIEGLENIENTNKAKTIGLKRKDKIVELYLEWGHLDGQEEKEEISSEEYVLDCFEPHPDLQILDILGFKGVRFPRWVRTMSVEPLQSGNPTQLNSLATVRLGNCKRCQQLPSLGQLPNLKDLRLDNFEAVECIGEEFYESKNNSSYTCSELPIIPTAGGTKRKVSFPNLIELYILNFGKLTTWDPPSSSATAFPSLESLLIWECPNLRKIPTTLQECTSLQDLWIMNCPSIEGPDVPDISRLQHLTKLGLYKAGNLSTSSPQRIRHLCGLTHLYLTGLTEEWDITLISSLSCLTDLTLGNCPNFKPQNSSLDFLSSSKLQSLHIHEFDEMEALPEWIGNLRSLQTLWLWDCKKLKYLPSKQAMQGLKLQCLEILRCPLLKERCVKHNNDGPADSESQSQWPTISHIPFIKIDYEVVQDLH